LQPPMGTLDPEELAWNLREIGPRERRVIDEYLRRAPGLSVEVRQRVGSDIAEPLADLIGARQPLDPTRFLERILFLRDRADTYDEHGPGGSR
jgi:hypothetical protein